MAVYTSAIILGNMLLEGAAIAVSVELACRNLYMPKQKNWTIRILKICMSVAMATKSVLFPMFFLDNMGNYNCQVVARTGDAFYHLSCVFGTIILLMRVNVVAPVRYKIYFNIFHVILVVFRLASGVVDVVTVRVWPDTETNQCHYKDRHQVGIAYTFIDLITDVYVSATVSWVLLHHIKKLHLANIRGNVSLYISVLVSNVFRTVILTVINIISTTYFFTSNANTAAFIFLWPVSNILYIILIGYDTKIADTVRYLQQLFRRQSHYDIHVNINSPSQPREQNDTPTDTTLIPSTTGVINPSTMPQSRPISHITTSDKGSNKTFGLVENSDIESGTSSDIDYYYSSMKPFAP
ncbi:hypothetical protein K501DRAFT_175735 [Backusella circina FSU 941]|nr:hypothetical protein K501DRAFT_175735 [Backusella circina FSU 941]